MSRPQDNHYSGPPPAYDVQTTYIPNDEVVPAVVPAQHGAPPPGSFGGPRGPPPPGGQYGPPPGQYAAPRGPPGGPYPPRGASPGPPGSMPRGPPPGQPGGPPPGLSFTESTANSYVSGNIGRPPVPPSGPSTTERQALIPTGRPQSDEPAPNINSSTAELPGAAFGRTQEEVEADSAKYAFYNARRYRPYFNIDTRDVWWRITRSLIGPFRADFMEVTMKRPDLYGPFWGSTTLIFITAVAGNLASYISWVKQKHKDERQPPLSPGAAASPPTEDPSEWYSDIGKLGTSAALIYGYVFIIGLLLYFVLRYFKGEMKLVNVLCIYGYALTIFIPVSLLCVIPIGWLRWVLVMVATAISGLFLLRNFKATIYAAAPAKASLMLIIIAALHVGLGITLRLFFFGYK